jgi:hemerythrin-like metal-binding protein
VAGSDERPGDQFIWNESLTVGNDQMDDEHKILIGYLNTIGEYKKKHEAGDILSRVVVARVIARLVDYTVFHFRDEELLLARYAYPNLASHKAIHRHLLEQLNILAGKFDTVGVDIVPVLFNFVSVWLKDHIMGVDQRYTKYVGKKDRNS